MQPGEPADYPRYYPVLLNIQGRPCVVVGGGEVAQRKAKALLDCAAEVVVIAAQATQTIGELARQGALRWLAKPYAAGDLAGASLVVAAATPEINAVVAEEARRERIPVNVVDDPGRCDFIVPAVVRRGPVLIAISSQGASPALARRLRELVEAQIGPEYGELAALLGRLRAEVLAVGGEDERRRIWQAILDSPVLELLREGKREEAELEARRCISPALG
jgi:precorrin-2 dehydrogenase/sirohydrochlorin ferrochelatase